MRSNNEPYGQDLPSAVVRAERADRRPSFIEDARRTQIVAAAIDVLARDGYAGASLAAIATHIGVSKGILSYHFAGKAELLQAVVTKVLGDAADWMGPRVADATSFADALQRYIHANLQFLVAHRPAAIALVEVLANARTTPGIPELYAEAQQGAVDAAEQLFAGGVAAGEFDIPSTRALAVVLRASIDTVTEQMRADETFDVDAFADDVTAIFDRAVR